MDPHRSQLAIASVKNRPFINTLAAMGRSNAKVVDVDVLSTQSRVSHANSPRPNIDTLIPMLGNRGFPRPKGYLSYDIDRETLVGALERMAAHVESVSRGADLTIIAIGGAVNVMLLGDRPTTQGVDFIEWNSDHFHRTILDDANLAALQATTPARPLGWFWFNNHVRLLINHKVYEKVVRASVAQNEVVFEKKGLKVIAAGWEFAFCMKLDRLTCGKRIPGERGDAPAYDVADAVSYLRRYITINNLVLVTEGRIKKWARHYDLQIDTKAIRKVTVEYQRRFGVAGIVRSPSEGAILSMTRKRAI